MADIKLADLIHDKVDNGRNKAAVSLSNLVYKIVSYLTQNKGDLIRDIGKGKIKESVLNNEIIDYIDKEKIKFAGYDREKLIKSIINWLYSYYVYQDLLDNPNVQEVRALSRSLTRVVEVKEGRVRRYFDTKEKFATDEEYNSFIEYIASRNGRELNENAALIQVTDKKTCKDGILRITITNRAVDGKGDAKVLFAKTPNSKKDIDDLVNLGMLNESMKEYYIDNLHAGVNMIFVGIGGAGKTNLINAIIEEIEEDVDTLIIQRDPELHSKKENIIFEDIHDEMEGGSLAELTRAAMKQRIKCFAIGELEGKETFDFLNVGFSGHQVLTSMHVDNEKQVVTKATQYAQYSDANLSEKTYEKIFSTMTCITYMDNFKCINITEQEWDEENQVIKYTPIFKYDVINEDFIRVGESCDTVKRKQMLYKGKKGLL